MELLKRVVIIVVCVKVEPGLAEQTVIFNRKTCTFIHYQKRMQQRAKQPVPVAHNYVLGNEIIIIILINN
jgi:hypothetical protein